MVVLSYVIIASLGAIIGSFLNVVILRLNTGRSLHGKSSCASCGKGLIALELIPVLSYLAQGGRCRKCKSRISLQYVLIEVLMAALYLLIFHLETNSFQVAFMISVSCLMVIILGYDMKHMIIPDNIVYSLAGLGAIGMFFDQDLNIAMPSLVDVTAGPIMFLFFYALWQYSKGVWLGLGDGKLALAVGLLLGYMGYSALMFAFWAGAIFGVSLIASKYIVAAAGKTHLSRDSKHFTMKSEVPFAPFLILGFYIVYALNINVLDLVLFFS